MARATPEILVLGLGNELLGDEGLGIHVVRLIARQRPLPKTVAVFEAGTSLFNFISVFPNYSLVVLVDAISRGGTTGTIWRTNSISEFKEARSPISLHEWGIVETMRSAEILKMSPKRLIIIGAEPESIGPTMGLSPALARAAKRITNIILRLAEQYSSPQQDPLRVTRPSPASRK